MLILEVIRNGIIKDLLPRTLQVKSKSGNGENLFLQSDAGTVGG